MQPKQNVADWDDYFPSKYLKAEDFEEGEQHIVTIERFTSETFKNNKGENEVKPLAHFAEFDKALCLNKTNSNVLKKLFGTPADCIGKQVVLFTMDVQSFDEIVRAIRLKAVPVSVKGTGRASLRKPQSEVEAADAAADAGGPDINF